MVTRVIEMVTYRHKFFGTDKHTHISVNPVVSKVHPVENVLLVVVAPQAQKMVNALAMQKSKFAPCGVDPRCEIDEEELLSQEI